MASFFFAYTAPAWAQAGGPVIAPCWLSAASLREKLFSQINSGFTVTLIVEIEQQEQPTPIHLIAITFDLWEERYKVRVDQNQSVVPPQDIEAHLCRALEYTISPEQRSQPLTLRILLNPIEGEKSEKLKQWLSKNALSPSSFFSDFDWKSRRKAIYQEQIIFEYTYPGT